MRKPLSYLIIITLSLCLVILVIATITLSIQGLSSQTSHSNSYNTLQELKVGDDTWSIIESDKFLGNSNICSRSYALTKQSDHDSAPEVIHEICDERDRAEFSLSTNLSGDRPPLWQYAWNPKTVNVEYTLTLHDPDDASRKVHKLLFVDGEEIVRTYHDRENDHFSIIYPDQNEVNFELSFTTECILDDQVSGMARLESIALRDVNTEQITSTLTIDQNLQCFNYYGETSLPSVNQAELSTVGVYLTIYPDVIARIHQGFSGELMLDIVGAPWIE